MKDYKCIPCFVAGCCLATILLLIILWFVVVAYLLRPSYHEIQHYTRGTTYYDTINAH